MGYTRRMAQDSGVEGASLYLQRVNIARELLESLNMSPERVLEVHNAVNGLSKTRPDLTALCKLGRSLHVRRMMTVPPRNWRQGDFTAAESVLAEIEHLSRDDRGEAEILALGVLGVEDDTLDALLKRLTGDGQPEPEPTTLPARQAGKDNPDASEEIRPGGKRRR